MHTDSYVAEHVTTAAFVGGKKQFVAGGMTQLHALAYR